MKLHNILFVATLLLGHAAFAQATTRPVQASWSVTNTTGVLNYVLSSAPSAAGPWTVVKTVAAPANSYTDNQPIGTTVFYQVVAVAAACTPTTPVTTVCGTSSAVAASTTIPPLPAIVTLILNIP